MVDGQGKEGIINGKKKKNLTVFLEDGMFW